MTVRAFLFAGGGTGGHLYPGLAIREHLARLAPDARFLFLCSDRPLDAEILAREGVAYQAIPARPLALRPAGLARFLMSWGSAVRAARGAIRQARERDTPVDLVAMGGFVAAPAAQGARAERCPVTLVNLDAAPGKANRWIARRAGRIVTAAAVPNANWTTVPPIVRSGAVAPGPPEECRRLLGLDPGRKTLLVTGASQGARSLNQLALGLVDRERRAFASDWQVIHQTGKGEEESIRAAYRVAGVPAVVEAFFPRMGVAWGAADLAVSRAGAGSVAEAWANRVPVVFLPYPFHRDRHQQLNAQPLEEAGGAMVVEDRVHEQANLAEAGRVITELMGDAEARSEMREALARLGPVDGAERVARLLLGLG